MQYKQKLTFFPVFFKVGGRIVVIVGSGSAALAKIRLIAETCTQIVAIAPGANTHFQDSLRKICLSGGNIKWINDPFRADLIDNAVFVFAATGDFIQNYAVAKAAEEKKIPVNVVDYPPLCDFFTPALINRAPIAIAVGSQGVSPILVQIIRSKIESFLCSKIGQLASFSAGFRKKVSEYLPKGKARRIFWRNFFTGPVAVEIMQGNVAMAKDHARRLLKNGKENKNFIYFLLVDHGLVDWITLGGQRALMEADVLVHDKTVAKDILDIARREARLFSVSSSPSVAVRLIKRLKKRGFRVLRLTTCNTSLAEEIKISKRNRMDCIVIPSLSLSMFPTLYEENRYVREKLLNRQKARYQKLPVRQENAT